MERSGVVYSEVVFSGYLSAFPVLRKVVDVIRITPTARERLIIIFAFTLNRYLKLWSEINNLFYEVRSELMRLIRISVTKIPYCHPELVSGSLNTLLYIDSETILKQIQHRIQNDIIGFSGFPQHILIMI